MRRIFADCPRALLGATAVLCAGAAALAADAKACDDEKGFVSIFDGKTLNGWDVFYGDPEKAPPDKNAFVIDDGALHCRGLGDYWLRYRAEKLDNFVLRFQYKLSKGCNSGVCIRTADKGIPWQTGFEVQILDCHGRDPDTHTDGAIYDVVTPMYNETKPTGEWNEMEITCCGKLVKVVVNGIKLIDVDFGKLTMPLGKFKTPYAQLPLVGWVTFQDHGMAWWMKNVRLKKLDTADCPIKPAEPSAEAEAGFEPIFDGKTMNGWAIYSPDGVAVPKDNWVVQDGYFRCNPKSGALLRYEKEPLGDCVVRGEFRIQKGVNSGIILRSKKNGEPCYTGFEIQVYDDHGKKSYKHCCGSVYDIATPMFNACKPVGEWNQFEITTDGLQVKVVLNGWKVIDTEFSKFTKPRGKFNFAYADLPRTGYLCFQDHGGVVDYSNIQVKKIRH